MSILRQRVAQRIIPGSKDQDRILYRGSNDAELIVVADGAGGTGGGEYAAETVIEYPWPMDAGPGELAKAMARLDYDLSSHGHGGQSTAVVVMIRFGLVFGASAGDSGAWMLASDGPIDLTHRQQKPLLGSGEAMPAAFGPAIFNHRLLIASDGLLKYAPYEAFLAAATEPDIEMAAYRMVQSVRLPDGEYPDDVALVLIDPTNDELVMTSDE